MPSPQGSNGISIRWLLLGANALVILLPLSALVGFRIYDTYLLRQTERQLIAQAVDGSGACDQARRAEAWGCCGDRAQRRKELSGANRV
jgi:hypothetical protein